MLQIFSCYIGEDIVMGFIDNDNDYKFIVSDARAFKDFTIETYEDFYNYLQSSGKVDYQVILGGLVGQCFWSDNSFIKQTRAKLKLLDVTGGIELDNLIAKAVKLHLSSLKESVDTYIFNIIISICKDARLKGIREIDVGFE